MRNVLRSGIVLTTVCVAMMTLASTAEAGLFGRCGGGLFKGRLFKGRHHHRAACCQPVCCDAVAAEATGEEVAPPAPEAPEGAESSPGDAGA